jgi:3-oxoacyl-(acyl-carrier-protein) synthase/thioesterase domain-containing protein/acyl carrier protein
MACRFPGAANIEAFWKLLSEGGCAIHPVPPDRALLQPLLAHEATKWGGFLSDIDQFDADFFGIAPREAAEIDPQQRLLLEVAWEALEDAGIIPRALAASATGVFVGLASNNWASMAMSDLAQISPYTNAGVGGAMAANRLSYTLDLRGPSLVTDTACSSSLVAIHQACRSLAAGECNLALAGGVNLMLSPGPTVGMAKIGTLPPDGVCRVFDANARGTARGEGAALLVLKPLEQAQADGDRIYAIIRGSAVNHGGKGNGLMAPNRWAQEAVLKTAWTNAGVAPADIRYVECHSTATPIGDATELTALGEALRTGRPKEDACAIGSLKPNCGHLEAAAGVAGVIKVALMLHHRRLVPTLNYQTPNPHIPWPRLPLRVQSRAEAWPNQPPGVAAVSSTGYGGVNAHLVLQSAGDAAHAEARSADVPVPQGMQLLLLSGRNESALRDLAGRYAAWIQSHEGFPLAALCATAAATRSAMNQRLALTAVSMSQMGQKLKAFAKGILEPDVWTGRAARKAPAPAGPPAGDPTDRPEALRLLARQFIAGAAVCWQDLDCGRPRRDVPLPTYPFQRQRHWAGQCEGAADVPGQPHPEQAAEPTHPPMAMAERATPAQAADAHAPKDLIPPREPLQREMAAIWREVLGVPEVGLNSDFFDLGGHSLLALELFTTIEQRLGRTLPLASLFEAPTLGELADLFERHTPFQSDPVVVFNPQGMRRPLFLLPGVGGHAFSYRALAIRLGADQPMCVMQAPTLDAGQAPLDTVEDIAAAFLKEIRRRQPAGPYRLCGYSFGGQVAYEIARQLLAAGEQVEPVVLIDAQARGGLRKRPFWRRMAAHLNRLQQATPARRRQYLRDRWENLMQRLRPSAPPHTLSCRQVSTLAGAINQVTEANGRAWHAYVPRPCAVQVVLFRCEAVEEWRDFYDLDETSGWGPLARGGVTVYQVKGPHQEVLDEPYVKEVAQLMTRVLERCAGGRKDAA